MIGERTPAAAKPLVITDSYDGDAAPQPVCLMAADGTSVTQAAHVDGESGTVAQIVDALVAAVLMAPASEA